MSRDSRRKSRPVPAVASAAGDAATSPLFGRLDPRLVQVALLFLVTFAVFDAVLLGMANTRAFGVVREGTAVVAAAIINATGVDATLAGTDITLSTRILRIDPDCTGLVLVAMFASLVIAYPVSARMKAVGLLVGIPAVLAANMFRLVAVAHASELLSDEPFMFAHDYLFKVFMVAVVVALWAGWLAYARRNAR